MEFGYEELKECINDDFNEFLNNCHFTEQYMVPGLLAEYKYRLGFNETENLCIHLFLLDHYLKTGWNDSPLKETLLDLLPTNLSALKDELGDEYPLFVSDFSRLVKDISYETA